jgi:hypothetical protein
MIQILKELILVKMTIDPQKFPKRILRDQRNYSMAQRNNVALGKTNIVVERESPYFHQNIASQPFNIIIQIA